VPKHSRRRLRTVVVALVTGVALVGATLAVAAFIGRPPPPKHRAATRPPPPLLSPAGIHVASACDGFLAARAVVRWQPSANRAVDGYAIYRSQSADGPWRKVELVGSRGVGSFVDHGLDTSTGYFYVIQATSGSHVSGFSSPVQVRTPSFCLF
jgi:hypothetical protein